MSASRTELAAELREVAADLESLRPGVKGPIGTKLLDLHTARLRAIAAVVAIGGPTYVPSATSKLLLEEATSFSWIGFSVHGSIYSARLEVRVARLREIAVELVAPVAISQDQLDLFAPRCAAGGP